MTSGPSWAQLFITNERPSQAGALFWYQYLSVWRLYMSVCERERVRDWGFWRDSAWMGLSAFLWPNNNARTPNSMKVNQSCIWNQALSEAHASRFSKKKKKPLQIHAWKRTTNQSHSIYAVVLFKKGQKKWKFPHASKFQLSNPEFTQRYIP